MLGVILFGCRETANPLEYPGVKVVGGGLTLADWDTVAFLRDQVAGSDAKGDWVDALVVACDFLKNETEGKKYTALKIVLFSELGCPADSEDDQVELIIEGMKLLDNIDFTHIGPDWGETDFPEVKQEQGPDSQGGAGPSRSKGALLDNLHGWPPGKPRSLVQRQNEELVARLVHETDGMICTLDQALATFLFKSKKKQRPAPWKVDFEVGPDIRITTSGFIRLRRAPPKSWGKCLARPAPGEEDLELKADVTFVRNNEEQEEVDDENMVVAYKYGPEMVVISREDEEAARHKGEDAKKLQLFGFLSRNQIRPCDLVGDGCMVFLPQDNDPNSEAALAALSEAMLQLGVVAIVRKAYRKGTAAKLGVLAPEASDDGGISLTYIELPFAEEVRDLSFPSLPQPGEEQLSVMDDLIDAMMLTQGEGEDRVELLKTEDTLNPSNQYLYQVLTERSMRPGCVIPTPADHISAMLQPPALILEAMRPVAARMREVFTTEEMVKTKAKRTAEALLGNGGEGDQPEAKKPREDLEMGTSVAEVINLKSIATISCYETIFFRLEALAPWKTSGRLLEEVKLWMGWQFSWKGWCSDFSQLHLGAIWTPRWSAVWLLIGKRQRGEAGLTFIMPSLGRSRRTLGGKEGCGWGWQRPGLVCWKKKEWKISTSSSCLPQRRVVNRKMRRMRTCLTNCDHLRWILQMCKIILACQSIVISTVM